MRGKPATKRQIINDPKTGSLQVAKFINYLMLGGKKITAQKIMYAAFDIVQEKTKKPPLEIFTQAMKNAAPTLEVRSRRVGGANYQIPFPVRPERRVYLAAKWIIDAARGKKGRPMAEKLAQEFMDASSEQGAAIKKKLDVHRMAEANKAFAHFAKYSR
jgi:small subunit ribosomal protein S7